MDGWVEFENQNKERRSSNLSTNSRFAESIPYYLSYFVGFEWTIHGVFSIPEHE